MRCEGLGHHGGCARKRHARCPCYVRIQADPGGAKVAGEGAVGVEPEACARCALVPSPGSPQVPSRPFWKVLG